MRLPRWALASTALLLPACSPGAPPPPGSASPSGALVVVTAGGTALVDGQADVPPTLDLRVSASRPLSPAVVAASLDGVPLPLSAATGGAVAASVAAMPLGSAHRLDLDLPGRAVEHIGFHVVSPAGALAAVHDDPRDGTVLDLAFELAPDHRAVAAALPEGGAVSWVDDRHLRAAWAVAPGGTLQLPATLAAARGSHLAAALNLALAAVPQGRLRTALVPAPPDPGGEPVVVAFTVGTARSRASLAAHLGQVSLVSPTGVGIDSDGSLSGAPDGPAVDTARSGGVPVWPLLQNDASDSTGIAGLLEDGSARGRLVDAARSFAARNRFPGLHLDIEGVPEGERDHLSDLVRALAAGLHADGRRLAVAVVPHKPGHLNVYSAAYDLRAISAAADLVTLMAYDEHTSLTDPGAVAGLDWDREILDGSLGELHSRAAGLLGLPLYARAWTGGDTVADSYAASLATALSQTGARVDYDFAAATPFVHGGDGRSSTWFDDATSLQAKLVLAASAHLRGIALWRLGFEDPALWSVLPASPARL
jgi:spore germination protein YaaH